jgi:hypothetical protein
MLKCKDIAEKSSAYVDDQLPFSGRFGIYLHLLICVHCRRFIRQLKMMITGSRNLPKNLIDDQDVESIFQHIKSHQQNKE